MKKEVKELIINAVLTILVIALIDSVAMTIRNENQNGNLKGESEMATSTLFDTTIIEKQECINYDTDKGRIRFVHAWGYDEEQHLVEDETGNLWEVIEDVRKDEAMLLWIADNNTPEDVTDDIIIRVWREA
jgi:hypothetical protein